MRFMQGFHAAMSTEIIYSFVIIICCLMIYFGTRKLYELSSHKGIKYFRFSFLFFALAYFFRSFVKFSAIIFNDHAIFGIHPQLLSLASSFIFMYLSSIAIFYLLYSIIWKKLKHKIIPYTFYIIAFIISVISIFSRSLLAHIYVNLFLLILAFAIIYASSRFSKNKKTSKMHTIYLLLSTFLILNIIDTFIPNFLQSFQLIIYLASLGIFLSILYKVLTKIGS
jgi:hypothetical protein